MEYSNRELLNFAVQNGIIDLNDVQDKIRMNERQKYLKMHENEIWQGKDGKWRTYLPDRATGKRKLIKRTTEKSIKNVVVEFYKSEEQEPLIKDVFEKWMKQKLDYGEIKKQSYDRYWTDYNRFFKNRYVDNFENQKICYITENDLEDFIKTNICKLQLTKKSYNGLCSMVKGIFKYAKKHHYTDVSITNFFGDLEISKNSFKEKIEDPEREVFFEDEIPRVIAYLKLKHDDIRALGLLLMFQTGVRVGELSTLKYEDLRYKEIANKDIVKHYLSISRTEIKLKDEDGKWTLKVQEHPKSAAGRRDIIVTQEAVDTIEQAHTLNPSGKYLFMDKGNRISGSKFGRKLTRVCDDIGIDERTTHKIRKTYVTTLFDSKVDDSIIQEMVGHSDIATTRRYYYKSNKSDERKIEQIERALANID